MPPIVLKKQGVSHTPRSINMHLGPGARPMRVDAYVYAVEFPFTGASGLFNHAPESRDLDPPRATLNSRSYEGSIIVEVVAKDASEDEVRAEVDKQIAKIERYVAFQALQLDPFNSTLRETIREKVEARKTRVFKARRIAASLGYPIARRDDMPATYAAPITRKKIVPLPNAASAFMPEWTLQEDIYQEILGIIHSMTQVMERSPSAFVRMKEEDLRVHYLVQLNGRFQGAATGETFNMSGKTDVLLRVEDRNIFIGEFKFWEGEQVFLQAIDQVLSYLSWRDTKAAIVLLNRNKNFGDVLDKAKAAALKHPHYQRGPNIEGETKFRYVFGNPTDHNREVILTVLAFDVPVDEAAE